MSLNPPATPTELIAAYAGAHQAAKRLASPQGPVSCPRCQGEARYQMLNRGLQCVVVCPCGFGMSQGFGGEKP